jgi:hypothetical protein
MSRAPSTFRQTDVLRALKAVRAAGYSAAKVMIGRDGRIEIITAEEGETSSATPGDQNEWDEVAR